MFVFILSPMHWFMRMPHEHMSSCYCELKYILFYYRYSITRSVCVKAHYSYCLDKGQVSQCYKLKKTVQSYITFDVWETRKRMHNVSAAKPSIFSHFSSLFFTGSRMPSILSHVICSVMAVLIERIATLWWRMQEPGDIPYTC